MFYNAPWDAWAGALVQVPPLASEGGACCYICGLADAPGRFHPEKAAALGVPKGPMFGRLKAGQAVELPDGKTVQPAEVCYFVILLLKVYLPCSSCCASAHKERNSPEPAEDVAPL